MRGNLYLNFYKNKLTMGKLYPGKESYGKTQKNY